MYLKVQVECLELESWIGSVFKTGHVCHDVQQLQRSSRVVDSVCVTNTRTEQTIRDGHWSCCVRRQICRVLKPDPMQDSIWNERSLHSHTLFGRTAIVSAFKTVRYHQWDEERPLLQKNTIHFVCVSFYLLLQRIASSSSPFAHRHWLHI
jgi:hypothetical protein